MRYGRLAVLDRDLHLPGFGRFLLGQRHDQDSVLIVGPDLFGIDSVRKREAADEFAVAAFQPVPALNLLVFFELAVTAQRQRVVFHADVDVFDFYVGDIGLEKDGILGLENVHRGCPWPARTGFSHQPGYGVLEKAKSLEWIVGESGAHGIQIPFC